MIGNAHQPREEEDRWVLPTGEGVVTQLKIDFAFGFTIEQWIHIRISQPFVVHANSGPIEVDPEGDPESMGRLIGLHQAVVTDASVHKDGSLTVAFSDGRTLRVPTGTRYEAFEVEGAWPREESWRPGRAPSGVRQSPTSGARWRGLQATASSGEEPFDATVPTAHRS